MKINNKFRSILEANINLDKKFILKEQQSGTTTNSGTTTTGATTPTTTSGSTTTPTPQSPTTQTTTSKPMTDKELNDLPDCWKYNSSKLGLTKGDDKENIIIFNSKEGKPFCKKNK